MTAVGNNEGKQRPVRIAVGGFIHESNTFAPGETGMEAFQGERVQGNEAFYADYTGTRTSMGGAIAASTETNAELLCGFYASETPSAIVTKEAAEKVMDDLVASLDPDADGYLIILHGAMVAKGYPDVEGEVLRRIREKVGNKPLAMTLDLHANISSEMVERADFIVGYDTYPHLDAFERAVEAMHLVTAMARKEIVPTRALVHPRMLVIPQVMITETPGPMMDLMNKAFEIEKDPEVLNVTISGGFPYSDMPVAGMAFVVTTNNNQALADRYAAELGEFAWTRREMFRVEEYTPEEAVKLALAEEEGPVVLVEGSDNLGGGSPGDATHILQHLVGATKKSLIVIRDVEGAHLAHKLGVGATFKASIGGKADELHGAPVAIEGTIRTLTDGKFTHIGTYMTGMRIDMGKTAVIECGQLTVILTEKRGGTWDPAQALSVGLRAETFHILVVKAAIAWRPAYGHICKKIIMVDSPGCCASNLEHLTYEQLQRPIYPLDDIS